MSIFVWWWACSGDPGREDGESHSRKTSSQEDSGSEPFITDSSDSGTLASTADTGDPPAWDGLYIGSIEVDAQITPYGESPIALPCAGTASITVSESALPQIDGTLDCEFAPGYTLPGTIRGAFSADLRAEGRIVVGLTSGGYTPLVDGPWQGDLALVDTGPALSGGFNGQFVRYGTVFAWTGTFSVSRQ